MDANTFGDALAALKQDEDLDEELCWRLAESQVVGRVGFQADGRIQIRPVNFITYEGSIYFRTSAYGSIATHIDAMPASFEVDEIDREDRSGWSVLFTGTAHRVSDSEELAALWWPDRLTPWAAGIRSLWIGISAEHVSGRRVYTS